MRSFRAALAVLFLALARAAVTPTRTATLVSSRTASVTATQLATKSPSPSATLTPSSRAQAAHPFYELGTWHGGLFIAAVGFAGSVLIAATVALLTVVRNWQRARGLGGVVRDVQSQSTTLLPRFLAARRAEILAREFTPDEPDLDVAEPLPPRPPGGAFNTSIYDDEPGQVIIEEEEKMDQPKSVPTGSRTRETERSTWRTFFGYGDSPRSQSTDNCASNTDGAEGNLITRRSGASHAERAPATAAPAALPAVNSNVTVAAAAAAVLRPAPQIITSPPFSSLRRNDAPPPASVDVARHPRPKTSSTRPRTAELEQVEDPGTAPRPTSARTRRSKFLERERETGDKKM